MFATGSVVRRWVIPLAIALMTSCTENVGNGVVHCHYMMYACGDCEPQYRVDSVDKEELRVLVGKDVYVVRCIGSDEEDISSGIDECLICHDFTVLGRVVRDHNGYKVIADSMRSDVRPGCCTL